MQPDHRHARRRRRRAELSCPFIFPAIAAAAKLCTSGSYLDLTNAFVPPSSVWGPRRSVVRHGIVPVGTPLPPITCWVEGRRHRMARMVLGESAPAVCRRALQRAWRASSPEADVHEMEEERYGDCPMDDLRELDVRLTTFNLLAPCYKRIHHDVHVAAAIAEAGTGLLASQAKRKHTARESEFAEMWRERAMDTVDFIRSEMSSSDILCLQEFWFDPEYERIFRAALGDEYDFHTVRRTGDKSDGVAVLLRKGKWNACSTLALSLSPVGDRVALLMHLRSRREDGDGAGPGEDMILVNTHLAFPHNALDRVNQMAQIEAITKAIESFVRDQRLPTMTPRVVVGDLNVEAADPVCRHLGANGFRSAYASLHREQRVITHRNHRGEEVMVDHVFVKAPGFAGRRRGMASPSTSEVPGLVARLHEDVSVEEAMLLPGGVDAASWNSRFFLSDHRPLTVRLKFPAD